MRYQVTGRSPPSDLDREIFSLPTRWGGLGIHDPSSLSEIEFLNSSQVCGPIVENLKNGNFAYDYNCECAQMSIKGEIQKEQWKKVKTQFCDLSNQLSSSKLRSLSLASEKGASNWLTALPLKGFGFALHKSAFRDAPSLRYVWTPQNISYSLCM